MSAKAELKAEVAQGTIGKEAEDARLHIALARDAAYAADRFARDAERHSASCLDDVDANRSKKAAQKAINSAVEAQLHISYAKDSLLHFADREHRLLALAEAVAERAAQAAERAQRSANEAHDSVANLAGEEWA